MTAYHARSFMPPRVKRAQALAAQLGFTQSSSSEVGRFLTMLAATVSQGRIGEIRTDCGVGTTWLASRLHAHTTIVTVDSNADYAQAASELFVDEPSIQVLYGDWRKLAEYGPFQLLFADGGRVKVEHPDIVIDYMSRGGIMVLDDLTPEAHWPDEWKDQPDNIREFWLNSPRVAATEIRVTDRQIVIVAARLQ